MYGQWYFEKKYKYGRKRKAIQRHYLSVLSWADTESGWSLLEGEGRRALDVGCAYGFVVDLLSKLGYEALGIDISSYAVRKGSGKIEGGLMRSDAGHLPFRDESFDLVTCFAVFEHLFKPEKTLTEIYRVLKPSGVLVATTPNVNAAATVIIHVLAREPSSTHPSAKPPREWVKEILNAGFKRVKTKPFLLLPMPPTLLQRYFTMKTPLALASHIEILAMKTEGG